MRIPDGIDQFAHIKVALLGYHVRKKRVLPDIERSAKEEVVRADVEGAGQLVVGDVELEEHMAGR